MSARRRGVAGAWLLAGAMTAMTGLAACAAPAGRAAAGPDPLPTVRIEQVVGDPAMPPAEPVSATVGPGERVTLSATGADLRALLVALADAAGVSLVVDPAVQGRVTVHFADVAAGDALRRLIEGAGLMVRRPLAAPWGPTVFYVVPVNVNEADAATIQARFGVSAEMARFIVGSRIPPR